MICFLHVHGALGQIIILITYCCLGSKHTPTPNRNGRNPTCCTKISILIKSGKLVWMTFNWQFFLTINAEHCIYRSHVELTVSWCNLFSIFSATQVFFDIIIIWNMQVLGGLQKKKMEHHKEYLWINCFVCLVFLWTTNISLKFFRRELISNLVQTKCYFLKIFHPIFYLFLWPAIWPTQVTIHKRRWDS